jgi:fructokinase
MILCCGEALIDMIPAPVAGGGERAGFVPHSGGAVFNTAIALGRLGAPVAMLTGLSRDMFGRQLAQALTDNGVNTDLVITADRPSTLAFVELRGGHARYTFYDENSAGRMLAASDMPVLPDTIGALYFGGISLACEPCADAYAALLERAGDRAVMIDPNIRPGFIADEPRYRARLGRMLARADVVKVSDEDLDWLVPDEAGAADKAARLRADGTGLVVVTRGGEGAVGYLPDGSEVAVPARRTVVVDTVGAGDTFNAGVLARLAQGGRLTRDGLAALSEDALADALDFGARVAAITVSRPGADPPRANEL